MDFDKDNSPGYLCNHLARLFARALAQEIAPLGLAPAQFMTLLELWREDGLTQAMLVQRLDVEQATMAATLARMARDGLVRREPDDRDRRAQRVFLTDRAISLGAEATDAARRVNARALAGLSGPERETFVHAMRLAIRALQRGA